MILSTIHFLMRICTLRPDECALARESDAVRFTFHAPTRMEQRDITVPMALDCLRRGVIRRPPEKNNQTGWHECRMERHTAGKNVAEWTPA